MEGGGEWRMMSETRDVVTVRHVEPRRLTRWLKGTPNPALGFGLPIIGVLNPSFKV